MKILQKFYLFVTSKQFEQFHSALQRTMRDSATHPKFLAPFPFSRLHATLLSTFFPFLSVLLFFFHFNKSDFRCVFTKTMTVFSSGLNRTPKDSEPLSVLTFFSGLSGGDKSSLYLDKKRRQNKPHFPDKTKKR